MPHFLAVRIAARVAADYDSSVRFRQILQAELDRRRMNNRRYSLRAFAQFLRLDHSSLSQMLRGKRRLTTRIIRSLGRRLRVDESLLGECCAEENGLILLRWVDTQSFRPDSRWLAVRAGIPIDEVNVALQYLLRTGMLRMTHQRWLRSEFTEN